jgi:hypothetical protein
MKGENIMLKDLFNCETVEPGPKPNDKSVPIPEAEFDKMCEKLFGNKVPYHKQKPSRD